MSAETENKQTCGIAEDEIIKTICKCNKAPEVKEVISHIETAFAVLRPVTGDVLCYCTSKSYAEMISSSVKFASDMAIATMLIKR